jgi:amino acid adenylation domain-containing protein/non-ribosomal peptide synthase protein (TIGR01720 family)
MPSLHFAAAKNAVPTLTTAPSDATDYPASHGQASMWFLYRMAPDSAAYNIARAARFITPVDAGAWRRALQRLVDRHPALRTTFHDGPEGPIQRVHALAEAYVVAEDAPADLNGRLAAESLRPFDLERGPLMRSHLFQMPDGTTVSHLSMHHIVADLWSLTIFMQELGVLYDAEVAGQPAELPPVAGTYTAHVQAQRAMLESEEGERLLGYWKERLGGELPVLGLLTDRPRPAVQTYAGGSRSLALDPALSAAVTKLGRKHGATPFATLLTLYQVFLHRYTGQTDLIVGSPTAGRSRSELTGVMGYFVNPVAFRTQVAGDEPFTGLLRRVKETVLSGVAHAAYPFPLLVEKLQVARDASRTPIYQTMFVLQRAHRGQELNGLALAEPGARFQMGSLEMEGLPVWQQAATCDLTLFAAEVDGTYRLSLEYNTDLFDAATIDRMLAHFQVMLAGAVAAPDTPVGQLPLMTEAEREQVLHDWNRTAAEYPIHSTLAQLFERQAALTPEAPAVAGAFTFAELNRRANRLAHHLRGLGVGPDMLVGVCMERTPELLVALLGVLKAGGAYLPLDPAYPRERLGYMLHDAHVTVLLTEPHLADRLPATGARVITNLHVDGPETNPTAAAGPEHLAYVIYTSGSTGRPKGAMIDHRGLVNYLWWAKNAYLTEAGGGAPVHSSISFDLTVTSLWTPLIAGRPVHMIPEAEGVEGLAGALRAPGGFGLVKLTPAHVGLISQQLTAAQAARGAGALVIGGEALLPETIAFWRQAAPGTALINEYGPTETVVGCCVYWVKPGDRFQGSIPIGRPIANTYLYILDKQLQPVPVGVPGELYIGGHGVCRGYLNRPELTAERFVTDPFHGGRMYKTGDLCRYLADGNIDFLGRIDEQVKLRGFRIELGEIEAGLAAHPSVQRVAAVVRDTEAGKQLVAYVVPCSGVAIDVPSLKAHLRDRVPEYMVPTAFVTLDALPLSPNGKVDRKALPAPVAAAAADAACAPRTETEARLAAIWVDVLRRPAISIHDNFFELGGDSILSIQVVSRAQQAGLKLTPRDLFQHPTIAGLAAVAVAVGDEVAQEQGPVIGEVALAPIQRWFLDVAPVDSHHYNQSILLDLRRPLSPAVLQRALTRLTEHHDALRLRFRRGAEGGWEQTCAAPGEITVPTVLDAYSDEAVAAVQGSLDLEHGPLLAAALFPDRLLLTVHHLAVDGVSWRILLEDLELLCQNPDAPLPPKTASYQQWSGALRAPVEELEFWRSQTATAEEPAVDPGDVASEESVLLILSRSETEALIIHPAAALRMRPDEVMLTALTRTLGGARTIDLEGHGREDQLDLSRTVGWFTAIYPVKLGDTADMAPVAALKQVKEALRAVPNGGTGYGRLRYLTGALQPEGRAPELSFNYLGRMDLAETGLFAPVPGYSGLSRSLRQQRRHRFEIDALIVGGQLELRWSFSRSRDGREAVEELVHGFRGELQRLVEACAAPGAGGLTPSDVALARLSQGQIDAIAEAVGTSAVSEIYPLTPLQQGMHFHSRLSPRSGQYFVQLCLELAGDLNTGALRQAWQAMLERHDVLRTAFVHQGLEEPVQVVAKAATLPWQEEDWRGVAPDRRQTELERWLAADREAGFDLTRPPLMRLTLLREGEQAWRLIWSVHHLLIDGWSLSLILGELQALYGAYAAGQPARLSPALPFRQYAAWLQAQDLAEAEAYWRPLLADLSAPTQLPFGTPEADRSGTGEAELLLTGAESAWLQQMSKQHRLTLSTLIQGAWAALLSRQSGQAEVVFGSTVSGRPAGLPGAGQIVGPFINTLPVRVRLGGEVRNVSAWLQAFQDQQAAGRDYEFVGLTTLQGWSQVPRSQPIFESIVVVENYPLDASAGLGGVQLRSVRDIEQTNFPLTLIAIPGSELTLKLSYQRDRYAASDAARLLDQVRETLLRMAAAPAEPATALTQLFPGEERQLLTEWSGTATAYPREATIHQLFGQQAAQRPEAVALQFGGQTVTYADLDRRANRLAHLLRSLGVGPERLVGLCVERSFGLIEATLAILKAGGAYLPLDASYPRERLALMLEDGQVDVLITESHLAAQLPAPGAHVICIDTDRERWETLPDSAPACGATAENLCYVMYTSGSTGRPKGVAVTHRNVVRLVQGTDYARFGPAETFLQLAPVSFDAATLEIWGALLNGGRLAMMAPGAPTLEGLGTAIRLYGVTTLWLTAGLFHMMVSERLEDLAPLRQLLAGGDILSPADVRKVLSAHPHLRMINGYGPTENTTFTCCFPMTPATRWQGSVPVGRPIANTTVYVLDEAQQPVPIGAPGELYTGGDGLARGYLNQPDLTAERFVQTPYGRLYRTGDLVRWLPDGNIEFLGRIDTQVKLRGFRIELGEIEVALAGCPGVKGAVVVAREDRPGDKRLVGYVVPAPGSEPAPADLRSDLAARLPAYMVPSAFVFLERFPLGPTGKVDRKALPAPEAPARSAEYVAPQDQLEAQLAEIWSGVLGVEQVGVTDNFFELGGHSLLAGRMLHRVQAATGKEVSMQAFMAGPTVAQVAQAARGDAKVDDRMPLVPFRTAGHRPPIFWVHAGSGAVLQYSQLSRYLGPDQPFYGIRSPGLFGEQKCLTTIEQMADRYIEVIQRVQPAGPYLIGGWSMGGVIAYEMARRLTARGQEVRMVFLLDSYAPPALEDGWTEEALEAKFMASLALRLTDGFTRPGALDQAFWTMSLAEQRQYMVRRFREEQLLPQGIEEPQQTERWIDLNRSNEDAYTFYRPGPYQGRVLLCRAMEGFRAEQDPAEAWRRIGASALEVADIPGNHFTFVEEPHVKRLAEALLLRLNELAAVGDAAD